jgi:hypothetical protein
MKKNLLKLIVIFLLFLIPIFNVNARTLEEILTSVKNTLKSLGYIVCTIFMIVGGYQMITASGDPQKFETGKRTLLYASIGFIVILIVDNIIEWIKWVVGGGGGEGGGGGGGELLK